MGRIFSFEDIEQHRIPTQSTFLQAKELTLEALNLLCVEGIIYGARGFGSVALGTPTKRSDFDIVIVTYTDNTLPIIAERLKSIHEATNVSIEPITIPINLAKKGSHTIDTQFLKHINHISPEGNIAGNDPVHVIVPSTLAPSLVFEQYLLQKLRRLRDGIFANSMTDRDRVLQRALEAPTNVGRRALQGLASLDLDEDSKATVIRTFQSIFPDGQLIKAFNFLLERNHQYNVLLEASQQGLVNRADYESTVTLIARESIPVALEWVNSLAELNYQLGEGNAIGLEGQNYRRGKEG